MRPIKFRGRDLDSGEYVYGEFGQGATSGEPVIYFYDEDAQQWVGAAVDPDSVAQLVGYDANGNEVYEGDTVIEEYVSGKRQENIAHLVSMTQVPETAEFFFFPFPAPFTILKEADQ